MRKLQSLNPELKQCKERLIQYAEGMELAGLIARTPVVEEELRIQLASILLKLHPLGIGEGPIPLPGTKEAVIQVAVRLAGLAQHIEFGNLSLARHVLDDLGATRNRPPRPVR